MTDRNDTTQSQADDMTSDVVIDPWHKLQTGFKGIRLLKNPTRIKEIRDLAHELKADFNKQVVSLDDQQKQMSDELDQLSAKHEISALKDRISTIDKYLDDIQDRVKDLLVKTKQAQTAK